jgi:hypothetical protein
MVWIRASGGGGGGLHNTKTCCRYFGLNSIFLTDRSILDPVMRSGSNIDNENNYRFYGTNAATEKGYEFWNMECELLFCMDVKLGLSH